MDIAITKQCSKEDARKIFEKVIETLDQESENWLGFFTVSFVDQDSAHIFRRKI